MHNFLHTKSNPPFTHPPFKVGMPGFLFTLPSNWETVSYQFAENHGSFSFSSESGPHGQFFWRQVRDNPDIQRIILETHRRHLKLETAPAPRFSRHGIAQRIHLAHTAPGERFYAALYNPDARLLLQWIFPEYSEENAALIIPMLDSFQDNSSTHGRNFYALFGLELSLPAEFKFRTLEPYPAAITMNFENPRHHLFRAHRWGMADVVMQGAPVSNFYHRFLQNGRYRVKDVQTKDVAHYPGAEISFRARGKFGFDYLLGAWWRGAGRAFLNPEENRIYAFEHIAPDRIPKRESAHEVFEIS